MPPTMLIQGSASQPSIVAPAGAPTDAVTSTPSTHRSTQRNALVQLPRCTPRRRKQRASTRRSFCLSTFKPMLPRQAARAAPLRILPASVTRSSPTAKHVLLGKGATLAGVGPRVCTILEQRGDPREPRTAHGRQGRRLLVCLSRSAKS